jgi:hypothetical protein
MNLKRRNLEKMSGKSTKFTKIDGLLGLFGLSLCVQQMVK